MYKKDKKIEEDTTVPTLRPQIVICISGHSEIRFKSFVFNRIFFSRFVNNQNRQIYSDMVMTEMRMIRWMCGVSLRERHSSTELERGIVVEATVDVMIRCRLRWHGPVECKLLIELNQVPRWWWRKLLLSAGRE